MNLGRGKTLAQVATSQSTSVSSVSVNVTKAHTATQVDLVDINGDGLRETTRIRFVNGSRPFLSDSLNMRITAAPGTTIAGSSFGFAAVVRQADGFVEARDKCLGGTIMARSTGTMSGTLVITELAPGQPIRFPARGDVTLSVPLTCILAQGCTISAPDGGFVADGGGLVDGGGTTPLDGGVDGGPRDGGSTDGGADGGARDGG